MVKYFSLVNSFFPSLVWVFNFPLRPCCYNTFLLKSVKIQAIFVAQSLKISIWSCTLIYCFRLDSHSVLSRYPEQSFKFINSLPHWVVLYIASDGPRAVKVSLQYLFCIQSLPDGCPWSGVLVMDNNGGSRPIAILSSVIQVGSANPGLSVFPLVRNLLQTGCKQLGWYWHDTV